MGQSGRHSLLIAAVAAVVLFSNLGGPTLWDIDEPRNAVCAREMLERGDLVVPTFNGELRAHKPVLLYWFMMSAYELFGVSEFSARFWSAVFGIATALVTYQTGKRMFSPQVGLWSGIVLATSINFDIVARAATPDSIFLFFVTSTLALFVRGALASPADGEREWQTPRFKSWLGVYFAVGLAVLAKGPAGAVLPLGVIGLWLMIERTSALRSAENAAATRRARAWQWLRTVFTRENFLAALWSMRPFTGAAVVSAVALPWYVAVTLRAGRPWLEEFLLKHNVSRFLEPMENHRGPFFYYLVVICIGFFPWSLLLSPTLARLGGKPSGSAFDRRNYTFLACWAGMYVVFFSLASTKLPNYVLPAYPALALATAAWLHELISAPSGQEVRWLRRASVTLVLVGVALVAGMPWVAAKFLPGEAVLAALGVPLVLGGAAAWWLVRKSQIAGAVRVFGFTAAAFATLLCGFAVLRVDRHQHSADLMAELQQAGDGSPQLAAFKFFRPSWVFYSGQVIPEFNDPNQVAEFFGRHPQGLLLTSDKSFAKIKDRLPQGVAPIRRQPQFLKPGEIIVLGRSEMATRLARLGGNASTK